MHASGRPRETGRKWSMPREKIALAWSPRPGQARAIRGRTVISTAPGNGQTEAALAIVAAALASDRRRHVVLVGTTQADANDALGRVWPLLGVERRTRDGRRRQARSLTSRLDVDGERREAAQGRGGSVAL